MTRAEELTPRSVQLARAAAWTLFALIALVTLGPLNTRPHLTQDPQAERTLAYFLLGYVFALAYPRSRALVALGVFAGAVGLEMAQLLTIDRHAELRDGVAKSVGGLFGVIAVALAQNVADPRLGTPPSPKTR